MSEYDDTIQIKAAEVRVGDVLLLSGTVEAVKVIGHFTRIDTEKGALYPRSDALVAVREVVTD